MDDMLSVIIQAVNDILSEDSTAHDGAMSPMEKASRYGGSAVLASNICQSPSVSRNSVSREVQKETKVKDDVKDKPKKTSSSAKKYTRRDILEQKGIPATCDIPLYTVIDRLFGTDELSFAVRKVESV